MKTFAPGLAAHLAGGITTLCTCWRIRRGDGVVLGFTDHDRAVGFDGVDHEPAAGLEASDAVAHAGLQVGGLEVTGVFASERIRAEDIEAGLYDNARVESWLVNWAAPDERHLMRVGSIGEVRREGASFTAEIRSLAHALDQERGRIFRATCDAELGDSRCRVDLLPWTAAASVSATDGSRRISAALPGAWPSGVFDGGTLAFTGGANAGRRVEIARHIRDGATDQLELWQASAALIAAGDEFRVSAGCDKRFGTCRARFDNVVNFRGFPHMPGNDFALGYPSPTGRKDGGRLGR